MYFHLAVEGSGAIIADGLLKDDSILYVHNNNFSTLSSKADSVAAKLSFKKHWMDMTLEFI